MQLMKSIVGLLEMEVVLGYLIQTTSISQTLLMKSIVDLLEIEVVRESLMLTT
jgi:hypothetical protein